MSARPLGLVPGLAELPHGWSQLADALIEAVWLVDAASLTVVQANAAAGRLLGLAPEALAGRDVQSLIATPEDLLFWADAAGGGGDAIHSDTWLRRFDGTLVPVTRRATPVTLGSTGRPGYLVALQDRSEVARVEGERATLLAELQATLESTADGLLVVDLGGRIRAFNRRFATLWGLPESLLVRRDDEAIRAWMQDRVVDAEAYARRLAVIQVSPSLQSTEVFGLADGRVIERVTLPQSSHDRPIGRVFSYRDITERLAARKRIEELAQTDPLTGLPNRSVLAGRFDYALALTRREGTPFATLILDLDRFKHLNDTFGQRFGDQVLVESALRLKRCLRQVDTVGRLGGDQFVMVVHDADARGAERTARRLLDAIAQPFSIDGNSFTVTCSIGIALHPADGDSMDELVRHAGSAVQRVKEEGRASYRFHLAHEDVDLRARIRLDHAMRQGLERGDFRLHYQPQVELASGRIIGAEALVRWCDPELGDIGPAQFIPVAEDSGFIVPIGDWVLSQAVRQAAEWRARGIEMPVSINVSAVQFRQPNFVGRVAGALEQAGLPPQLLELELTESILLADANDALARMRSLADLGVAMAIDDFGTGYSSLGYLKRFPIRRLKIDRSFVRGLPGEESDEGIAQAIVNLARALKLEVIAEGVETVAQRDFLGAAGCDQYQGFLCSPAVPAERFEALLRPVRTEA